MTVVAVPRVSATVFRASVVVSRVCAKAHFYTTQYIDVKTRVSAVVCRARAVVLRVSRAASKVV